MKIRDGYKNQMRWVCSALLLLSCTASQAASEGSDCEWDNRANLDDSRAAFLSLIFQSPTDRFRPLGLKGNRAYDPTIMPPGLQTSYESIDRSAPFTLRIGVKGLEWASSASDDITHRMYINQMTHLKYPDYTIVLNSEDINLSIFGYSNILPVQPELFDDLSKMKSHVDEHGVETNYERSGHVCIIKSEFQNDSLFRTTLYINYLKYKDFAGGEVAFGTEKSFCRARMYAIQNGLHALTIPRMKERFNSNTIHSYGNKIVGFEKVIKLITSMLFVDIKYKGKTSYFDICNYLPEHQHRSIFF